MATWPNIILLSLIKVIVTTQEDVDYHKHFDEKELAVTFGVKEHDHVPKYVSTKVHGLQQLKDNVEHNLSLNLLGRKLEIVTSLNKDFIADTHTTEFVEADGTVKKYAGVLGAYSFGVVKDDPHSHVSFHHTAKGISGSIRLSDDIYIINPLPHRLKNEQNDHVVFRISDVPGDHLIRKSLNAAEDQVKELKEHKRTRRSTSLPKKTIEILIAADYKMLEFYGEEFLPSYMLACMNIVAGYYRDTSLSYPVDVVVVRSTIFKTDILKAQNVSHLLSQFRGWCNKNNNFDDRADDHFDNALLLTRSGCADGCKVEGLAYTSVVCNLKHSQGVAKDRGFVVTTTLAHELGHNLGGSHDGEDGVTSKCQNGINIMASGGLQGGTESLRWSKCSSETFEKSLKSPRSSCYDDVPRKKKTDSTFQLYGTVYNRDMQCRYMLGEGYHKCPQYTDKCSQLLCQYKEQMSCTSLYYPPLHGSHCRANMWCIDAQCVPDGTLPPQPIHGGWGAWGEYTKCNKPCDVGIQWRVRHCNNPEPVHGGDWCDKQSTQKSTQMGHYRTCNIQMCGGTSKLKDNYHIDRDEQCHAIKSGSTFCTYCSGIEPCSLWCGGSTYGTLEGWAKSGTYCTTDTISHGVCVHGRCTEMGCDSMLNSGKQYDRCGVCDGDGSKCIPVIGSDKTSFAVMCQKSV